MERYSAREQELSAEVERLRQNRTVPSMRELEPLHDPEAIAAERQQLQQWGYRWLILHRSRCRVPARAIPALTTMLGEGTPLSNGDLLWEL